MIHHVSIEADNPVKVATVIAELMGGRAREGFPFEHSCAAFSGDEYGTMFECWQRGNVVAIPESGPGKFEIKDSEALQEYQAFHTALSVKLEDDTCLSGYHPHPLYVVCLLGLQARAGAGALRRRSG